MNEKVVVITGAGSGLGASLAKKYSELGSHVCLLGRTRTNLERTAQTLVNGYSIYELDVTSKSEVDIVFQSIKENAGPIDLLINNAGLGVFDLAENIGEEAIHQMIDINLKGTIFCTQAVLPDMKERNQGKIANVISTAGIEGKVTESVYCASKFGVRGFTESLLVELKDSAVQVYAAYMGGMRTAFWDGIFSEEEIKNLMDPDDVAEIIMDNIKPRKNLNVTEVVIKNSF
ncbi:SDR family oxidoreductase [Bacillus sp. B15-48]|uniref:SDR family oxidoreductase n=1 Tax=Bacillus sp. B15-48 TaxID=1548601 RepID=UPI00193F163F|nr:SDR family oxidoreductase [Bacillus sp. B15-48]MBM4761236.1 SDR family NAD(P)-dependent oxidoreductase [Bacillus sp. B15-48]